MDGNLSHDRHCPITIEQPFTVVGWSSLGLKEQGGKGLAG